jgi:hypothetical protein
MDGWLCTLEYDYVDLMYDSVFALVPAGSGRHSYRYLEAMQSGAIPVILSDGCVSRKP